MSTTPVPAPAPNISTILLAILPALAAVSTSIQTLVDPKSNRAGKIDAVESIAAQAFATIATLKGDSFSQTQFRTDVNGILRDVVALYNDIAPVIGKKPFSL